MSQKEELTLTNLLQKKQKMNFEEAFQKLSQVVKNNDDYRVQIQKKDEEIEKLKKINQFLLESQKKRDQIISETQDENRNLRQKYQLLQSQLNYNQMYDNKQEEQQQSNSYMRFSRKSKIYSSQNFESFDEKIDINYQGILNNEYVRYFENMCKTLSEGNENQVQTKILQNLTNYITYLFQMLKKVNQTKYFFIDYSKLLLINDDNKENQKISKQILQNLKNLFKCQEANIYNLNEDNQMYIIGQDPIQTAKPLKGLVGDVIQNGNFLYCLNQTQLDNYDENIDFSGEQSYMCHPIKDQKGTTVGAIQVVGKKQGAFDKDDETLISQISFIIGCFKQLANNFQEIIYQNQVFLKTKEMEYEIYQEQDIHKVLKIVETNIQRIFKSSQTRMILIQNQQISIYDQQTDTNKFFPLIGIVGHCVEERKIIHVPNAYQNQFYNQQVDIKTSCPVITAPIIDEQLDEVQAVIQFQETHTQNIFKTQIFNQMLKFLVIKIRHINQLQNKYQKLFSKKNNK